MKYLWMVLCFLTGLLTSTTSMALDTSTDSRLPALDGMVSLTDEELAQEQGQALFNLSYLAPGQSGNPYGGGSNIGFYTFGMEAEVSINANIKRLQVGCGGDNGAGACDLDIENFSLGCIANASGTCITLPPTGNQKAGAVADTLANQQRMKDFVLTNPFYQFAIRNPNSASTREIIGIRIGASSVNGPMSFGSLNTFSGYLTGAANLTMLGEIDVAATCKAPGNCPNSSGQSRYQDASAFLNLNNATILDLGCPLIACVDYRDVTVNYGQGKGSNPDQISRTGLSAAVNGNRVTQAAILGLDLAGVVDDIIYGSATTDPLALNRRSIQGLIGWVANGFADQLLPLLRDGIAVYIKQQLAGGLGLSTNTNGLDARLNSYNLPYNLNNVHQLDVSSNLFGLAVSKESLQYPGYTAAVSKGWSMYIPNAFTLNIQDKVSTLVSNIAGSSNARDGNIVGLEAPYRNCWGTLTFC